jgi:hypothetical protein
MDMAFALPHLYVHFPDAELSARLDERANHHPMDLTMAGRLALAS